MVKQCIQSGGEKTATSGAMEPCRSWRSVTGVCVITAGADELADAQTASALFDLHFFTLFRSLHDGAPRFHHASLFAAVSTPPNAMH